MSPFLALVGLTLMGTWGMASIAMIIGGCFLLINPTVTDSTVSGSVLPGILLIALGLVSFGVAQVVTMPLLGLDPPIPIPAKKIAPGCQADPLGQRRPACELPDGTPKEVRLKSRRITLVRIGNKQPSTRSTASAPITSFRSAASQVRR